MDKIQRRIKENIGGYSADKITEYFKNYLNKFNDWYYDTKSKESFKEKVASPDFYEKYDFLGIKDGNTALYEVVKKKKDDSENKEIIVKYYNNLAKGVRLVEDFRKFITATEILYIIAEQGQQDFLDLELKNGIKVISGDKLLEQFNDDAPISSLNISIAKATKALDSFEKECKELIKLNDILKIIVDKINNYKAKLEMPLGDNNSFVTYYEKGVKSEESDSEQELSNSKYIKDGIYIQYKNQKERWYQWTKNSILTGVQLNEIIEKDTNHKHSLVQQNNKFTLFVQGKNQKYYSMFGKQGNYFEGLLHGAFNDVDIDTAMIMAKGNLPYFKGADAYYYQNEKTLYAFQAKAHAASISGDTTYNIISKIIKTFIINKEKKKENIKDFLIQNFIDEENPNYDTEKQVIEYIVNKLKIQKLYKKT